MKRYTQRTGTQKNWFENGVLGWTLKWNLPLMMFTTNFIFYGFDYRKNNKLRFALQANWNVPMCRHELKIVHYVLNHYYVEFIIWKRFNLTLPTSTVDLNTWHIRQICRLIDAFPFPHTSISYQTNQDCQQRLVCVSLACHDRAPNFNSIANNADGIGWYDSMCYRFNIW